MPLWNLNYMPLISVILFLARSIAEHLASLWSHKYNPWLWDRYQCKYPCYKTFSAINAAIQYVKQEIELLNLFNYTQWMKTSHKKKSRKAKLGLDGSNPPVLICSCSCFESISVITSLIELYVSTFMCPVTIFAFLSTCCWSWNPVLMTKNTQSVH